MKGGRSCLANDPKSIACICFGGFWVCNNMLSYAHFVINFRIVVFAHTRWLFSYGTAFLPDARGSMLLYSPCYPLLSASYVPSFTLARKFVNYITFLGGRNATFFSRWLHNSCVVNHTGIHSIETRCNGFISLIFKL